MKRLGSALGMGLAAVALVLPGLGLDRVGAADAPEVRVTTVRYGPFTLPPAGKGGDVDHTNV
ncbi:MAG TPA: hypothetical protein VGQ80_08160, partial [Acidimicrobiia bacterium]|nr:hypothetical protein [Acidimicrobiia bacterium]